MKRKSLFAVFLYFALFFIPLEAIAKEGAILPLSPVAVVRVMFHNEEDAKKVDAHYLEAAMIDRFRKFNRIEVLSGDHVRKITQDRKINLEILTPQKKRWLAQKLRANALLGAKVLSVDERGRVLEIEISLYDGVTGLLFIRKRARGKNAVSGALSKVVRTLSFRGFVLEVVDGAVVIFGGRDARVKENQILNVFRISKIVKEGDRIQGFGWRPVGQIVVTDVLSDRSVSEVLYLEESSHIRKFDRVTYETLDLLAGQEKPGEAMKGRRAFSPYGEVSLGVDYLEIKADSKEVEDAFPPETGKFALGKLGLELSPSENHTFRLDDTLRYGFDDIQNTVRGNFWFRGEENEFEIQNEYERREYIGGEECGRDYYHNSSKLNWTLRAGGKHYFTFSELLELTEYRIEDSTYKNFLSNQAGLKWRFSKDNHFVSSRYSLRMKRYATAYADDNYLSHVLYVDYNYYFGSIGLFSINSESEIRGFEKANSGVSGDEKDSYFYQSIIFKTGFPAGERVSVEIEDQFEVRKNRFDEILPPENSHTLNRIEPSLKYRVAEGVTPGLRFSFSSRKDTLPYTNMIDESYRSSKLAAFLDIMSGLSFILSITGEHEFMRYENPSQTTSLDYDANTISLFLTWNIREHLSFDCMVTYEVQSQTDNTESKTTSGFASLSYEF